MNSPQPENIISQERAAFEAVRDLLYSAKDNLTQQLGAIIETDPERLGVVFPFLNRLLAEKGKPAEELSLGETLLSTFELLRDEGLSELADGNISGCRMDFNEFSINLAFNSKRQEYDVYFLLRSSHEDAPNHFSLFQKEGHLFLRSEAKPSNHTVPTTLVSVGSRKDALPFSQPSDIAYTPTYVERVCLVFCKHFMREFDHVIEPEAMSYGFIEIEGDTLEDKLGSAEKYLKGGHREEWAREQGIFNYRIAEESWLDHRLNSSVTIPKIHKILDSNQNDDWTILRCNNVPRFNDKNAYVLIRRGIVDLAYLDQETLIGVDELKTFPKGIVFKVEGGTPRASSGYIDVVDPNRDSLDIPPMWTQVDTLKFD